MITVGSTPPRKNKKPLAKRGKNLKLGKGKMNLRWKGTRFLSPTVKISFSIKTLLPMTNESEREDPDRQHLDSDVSIRELEDGDIEVSQQLIATDPTVRCINNLLGKVNLQRMVVPLKGQELVVQEN